MLKKVSGINLESDSSYVISHRMAENESSNENAKLGTRDSHAPLGSCYIVERLSSADTEFWDVHDSLFQKRFVLHIVRLGTIFDSS